jgi:hypothetical protein
MAAHVILRWTHRVFANLKRWALGAFHGLRRQHLKRCLDEFVFRWNRRRHTAAAFDTLLSLSARLKPATTRDVIDQRVRRASPAPADPRRRVDPFAKAPSERLNTLKPRAPAGHTGKPSTDPRPPTQNQPPTSRAAGTNRRSLPTNISMNDEGVDRD